MSKYIKRNRATGAFIEWDKVERGARSVAATNRHEVHVPMTEYEAGIFTSMRRRDVDYEPGHSGIWQYEIQD